jgi:branched-chain amino acid transport system ATP-binding protein
MSQSGLLVENVDAGYGLIRALWGVRLEVRPGEIVVLLGSNGAGKTTLLRTISGLIRPTGGRVFFEGGRLDTCPPEEIVRRGIAHVPEGRRVFREISVRDNLLLGAYTRPDRETRELLADVEAMFPILRDRADQAAGTLSGGEQQMLAIGRALMSRPKLLLLDEPSLGIMPKLVTKLFETIASLKEQTTILLVEQNVNLALEIADRGYVIENGRIVLEGAGRDLLANADVQRAYLAHEGADWSDEPHSDNKPSQGDFR